LVTDFRYASQATAEVGNLAETRIERSNLWEGIRTVVAAEIGGRIGVDRARMTLAERAELDAAGQVEWVPVKGFVEDLRASKDRQEIESVRDAATLAAAALAETIPMIGPGKTEIEVAAALEYALRRRGSEWHPFQPIVASGVRSALPHARASAKVIEKGDLLVIDFGAQLGGYCSDITRTFVVGARADERQRQVYDLVKRAHGRAIGGLRAGMTGKDADSLARDLISREGFGEAFGHSLGHGLGLEVHEAPRLSQLNETPLPDRAVVTVEPGVYLESWGGVRIEDDVVLTAGGAECLSDSRTDLTELT
jgi:Xaa-Pro aminopeptidase